MAARPWPRAARNPVIELEMTSCPNKATSPNDSDESRIVKTHLVKTRLVKAHPPPAIGPVVVKKTGRRASRPPTLRQSYT